jgi:hypothetical protein
MATFSAAEDLEKRYAVTRAQLLAYAQRGNLSMRRTPDGLQFDEAAVARLFPRRGLRLRAPERTYGVLGACKLGANDA